MHDQLVRGEALSSQADMGTAQELDARTSLLQSQLDYTQARLKPTRTMIGVPKKSLAARQENGRLIEDLFKEGVSTASQHDATRAQTMKAQAGLLETNLDYLLTWDELMQVLGASAK